MKKIFAAIILTAGAIFAVAQHPLRAAPAVSADIEGGVKKGLKIFSDASDNTNRMVMGKDYASIAQEHEDVLEAKQILDASLPLDLKIKADAAVIKAVAASTTLKDVAANKDTAKIQAAQEAFAQAVEDLIALFPKGVQP